MQPTLQKLGFVYSKERSIYLRGECFSSKSYYIHAFCCRFYNRRRSVNSFEGIHFRSHSIRAMYFAGEAARPPAKQGTMQPMHQQNQVARTLTDNWARPRSLIGFLLLGMRLLVHSLSFSLTLLTAAYWHSAVTGCAAAAADRRGLLTKQQAERSTHDSESDQDYVAQSQMFFASTLDTMTICCCFCMLAILFRPKLNER